MKVLKKMLLTLGMILTLSSITSCTNIKNECIKPVPPTLPDLPSMEEVSCLTPEVRAVLGTIDSKCRNYIKRTQPDA